jgi:RNA polymerase sigma factor (sigma-70 family)
MKKLHNRIHISADRMALYFSARVRHADYEDCYQEAWLALLGAVGSYDPAKGPWAPWAARVAGRHIRAHLYSQKAPVSGPRSRAAETVGTTTSVVVDTLAPVLASALPSAESALSERQASRAVTSAVNSVTSSMESKRCAASRAVLLRGLAPREAADEVGLPAEVVSWAVRRARSDIKRRHGDSLRVHL